MGTLQVGGSRTRMACRATPWLLIYLCLRLVASSGIEPELSALRGRRVNQLHHDAVSCASDSLSITRRFEMRAWVRGNSRFFEGEFLDDRNTIRQEARKALEKVLTEEMKIDQAARQKIASQRKIIVEGSQEWDILYRKYYNDEVRKLGV